MDGSDNAAVLGPVRIGVISTTHGDEVAIQILRWIARPPLKENPMRNRRVFGEWERIGGVEVCRGVVHSDKGWTCQAVLEIHDSEPQTREGLRLRDVPGGIRSLKSRSLILNVGRNLSSRERDIRQLANMIAACYIVRGFGSKDRCGVILPLDG